MVQLFGLDVWALASPYGLGFFLRLFMLLSFLVLGGWFFSAHLSSTKLARLLHSLVFGWIIVSFTAFLLCYATGFQTNPPLLLIAACLAAGGGIFFQTRLGAPDPLFTRRGAPCCSNVDLTALACGLVAAGLVAMQFDDYLSARGSCFMQDITGAARPFWAFHVGFTIQDSQSLGNAALVAPFYAVLGMDGFRIFNVFAAMVSGMLLVRLGHALFGRLGYGLAVAAAGLFTPYFLQIPTADENIVAMTACAAFLYTLLVEPAAVRRHADRGAVWKKQLFLVGLTYGAYVSSRYIQALSLPAIVYYLWKGDFGLRRTVVFRRTAAPFTVITALILLIVARNGVPFERPFFNAPFGIEQFSRSPFRAMPTAVMLPIYWTNQFGILLSAIALTGLAGWLVSRRPVPRFLAAFFLPAYLLLSWMEFFLKPNKNGIPLMFLPIGCLAFGYGLKWLCGERRRLAFAAAIGAAGLLYFSVSLAARTAWPVYPFGTDGKFQLRPKATIERPYSTFERDELLSSHWLPDWHQYGRYSSPAAWWKRSSRRPWLNDMWCSLYPLQDRTGAAIPNYPLLEIDIDEPFDDRAAWLRPITGESTVPLLGPLEASEHFTVIETHPSWTSDTVYMNVLRCGETLYLLRLFDDIKNPGLWGTSPDDPGPFIYKEGLQFLRPFHNDSDFPWVWETFKTSREGRLTVPVSGIREIVFFEVLINSQEMAYWWRAILEPDGVTLTTPKLFWSP